MKTIEEKDNYLEVATKKFSKKVFKFRMINFAAIALTILFVLLNMYFFNNFNRIRVYVLNGDSDTFTYTNGIFAESSQKFILKSGTFEIKNDKVKENIMQTRVAEGTGTETKYLEAGKENAQRREEINNYYQKMLPLIIIVQYVNIFGETLKNLIKNMIF